MTPQEQTRVTLRLDLDIYERLDELKAQTGKSLNQLIVDGLRGYYCVEAPPTDGLVAIQNQLANIVSRLEWLEDNKSIVSEVVSSNSVTEVVEEVAPLSTTEESEPTILTKQELAERLGSKVSGGVMSALTALATANKPVTWTSKYDPEGLGWKPTDDSREQWVVDSQY